MSWLPPKAQPWSAVCEPLGSGWASKVLLARVASYASHPSQFSVLFDYTHDGAADRRPTVCTGAGGVDRPPRNWEPRAADQLTPESARRTIMAGQAAMAFVLAQP